jgi:hypothetical protein
MTKDKFRELCDQVLVPKISDAMHRELAEQEEILGGIFQELMHVRDKVEALVTVLSMRDEAGDL